MQRLNRFLSLILVKSKLSANPWQEAELDYSIRRKALGQIIGERLCPERVPCQGQSQRRCKLRIPVRRKAKCSYCSLPRLDCIAEEAFPHGRRGFVGRRYLLFSYSLG